MSINNSIIECDGNKYGLECKTSCNNCVRGEQCHHVTGSCPNGCDAGFHGGKCDKGKYYCMYDKL